MLTEVGLNVTKQLPALSEQVKELNLPDPVLAKVIVPVGMTDVPGLVSITVAVQVTVPLSKTGLLAQVTLTDMVR